MARPLSPPGFSPLLMRHSLDLLRLEPAERLKDSRCRTPLSSSRHTHSTRAHAASVRISRSLVVASSRVGSPAAQYRRQSPGSEVTSSRLPGYPASEVLGDAAEELTSATRSMAIGPHEHDSARADS